MRCWRTIFREPMVLRVRVGQTMVSGHWVYFMSPAVGKCVFGVFDLVRKIRAVQPPKMTRSFEFRI